MKLTLLYPPPSPEYESINYGYEHINTAPQTAHAVLAAYLERNFRKSEGLEIETISDQEVLGTDETTPQTIPEYRNRKISDLIGLCVNSDLVGMTCSFHNQRSALELAGSIKKSNPGTKIVFGGQNVSSKVMARMILEQFPAVDYIVRNDGEEALVSIANHSLEQDTPNLAYRGQNGNVRFTKQSRVSLDDLPLWDFRHLRDRVRILQVYDSRTGVYNHANKLYHGMMPRIGVFSLRGCIKAAKGVNNGSRGPCSYCTTGESFLRTMNPQNFWKQIAHLYDQDGLQDFFIADDVFAISPEYVKAILQAEKDFVGQLSPDLNFRAYAYPSTFQTTEAEEIARKLKEIRVNNIFIGVETFDQNVSRRANKDWFSYETVSDALTTLKKYKIDSTIPIMPGLPGETEESLELALRKLEKLLNEFGSKEFGLGGLTRVDISPATPLIGTAWYHRLTSDPGIKENYFQRTGQNLQDDVAPDYNILREAETSRSGLPPERLQEYIDQMTALCKEHLRPELVGGFNLVQTR